MKGILDARSLYSDSSFANLYDELTMPVEFRKAYQENDKAVMTAYGFTKKAPFGAIKIIQVLTLKKGRKISILF